MDGFDFCKKILEHPHGGVKALMNRAKDNECEWLEFKASIELLPEDQEKHSQKDLYWEIAKAVIAMMNTYGGAVIIGIKDTKPHDRVPLEDNDPKNIIGTQGIGDYLRYIRDKIWSAPNGKKSWGAEKKYYVDSPLPPDQIEIKSFPYQGGPVAVILVKPITPCLKIWKGSLPPDGQQQLLHRSPGDHGESKPFVSYDQMVNYENSRKIEVVNPFFDQDYKVFTEHLPENRKKSQIFCEWSIITFLIIISCVIWLLPGVWWVIRTLTTVGCLFSLWLLPIIFPPPPVKPIPGKKTPDQIIVPHPLPTIEGQCLNNKHWWIVSDEIETCYGKWELQRHKVFGNFRIVDPRNITRCWGTQKMVIPVFEKLKSELEKECPSQKS